jgi:hypothetical protein
MISFCHGGDRDEREREREREVVVVGVIENCRIK